MWICFDKEKDESIPPPPEFILHFVIGRGDSWKEIFLPPKWQFWNPRQLRRGYFERHKEAVRKPRDSRPPLPQRSILKSKKIAYAQRNPVFTIRQTTPGASEGVWEDVKIGEADSLQERVSRIIDNVMKCGHHGFNLQVCKNDPRWWRIKCSAASCDSQQKFTWYDITPILEVVQRIAKIRRYKPDGETFYLW